VLACAWSIKGGNPTVNGTNLKFSIQSRLSNRARLGIAISLFSSAALAQTYPVSGVWVARDERFPSSGAGACLTLKKDGVDAIAAQSFPTLMIFSEDKRFEVRRNYLAERTIKSVKGTPDGGFRITEAGGKHWLPWPKKWIFRLKIVNPTTIEITKEKVSTRFFKCSSNSPSL
jgi:hypothetical protein